MIYRGKVVIFFDLMSNRFLLFYPFENFTNYRVNRNKKHKLSDIYYNHSCNYL